MANIPEQVVPVTIDILRELDEAVTLSPAGDVTNIDLTKLGPAVRRAQGVLIAINSEARLEREIQERESVKDS